MRRIRTVHESSKKRAPGGSQGTCAAVVNDQITSDSMVFWRNFKFRDFFQLFHIQLETKPNNPADVLVLNVWI